jgi:bifunctional non-homologous end joining protein LigD
MFIEPALATLRDRPPSVAAWVHEIKFDGCRLSAFWELPADRDVIDDEVVVLTTKGRSDFGALEDDLGAGRSDRFTFFAFDLLYLNCWELRACALIARKRVLEALIGNLAGRQRYSRVEMSHCGRSCDLWKF